MDDDLRRAVATMLDWQRYLLIEGQKFGRELLPEGSGLELPPESRELEVYYETQRLAFTSPIFFGRLLYVASASCDVLQDTVDSLDHDVALEASWFRFSVGFVYFQRELELPLLVTPNPQAKRGLAFRASGWTCLKLQDGHYVMPQDPLETEVVMWTSMMQQGHSAFFPLSFLSWTVGQSLHDCIAAKDAADEPWNRYRDSIRHELGYAAAFLLLSQSAEQQRLTLDWEVAAVAPQGKPPLRRPDSITTIVFRHPH